MHWRRDVRHFRSDPVPEAQICDLLRIACLAPSVGHAQPWRFVRIRTASLREQLADHVDAQSAQAASAYRDDERAARYRTLKLHGIRQAPEVMAVFCDEQPVAGHGLGIATMPEMLRYSCVMAIHGLWLTARARGVGLGWVSILDPRYVGEMLDMPADWALIAILCMGYPQQVSAVPELERRGWQDREPWTDRILER